MTPREVVDQVEAIAWRQTNEMDRLRFHAWFAEALRKAKRLRPLDFYLSPQHRRSRTESAQEREQILKDSIATAEEFNRRMAARGE